MIKKALITPVRSFLPTGQAGRIDHLVNNPEIYGKRLFLHYGDLTDSSNLNRLLEKTEHEVKLNGIHLNRTVRRRSC